MGYCDLPAQNEQQVGITIPVQLYAWDDTNNVPVRLTGASLGVASVVPYIYFGDPGADGTWLITPSGNNLSFQRRENGVYIEKDSLTP